MALLPRLRFALGVRRPARPHERRIVRIRRTRRLCCPAELRPAHQYPLDALRVGRRRIRGARLHALLPLVRKGTLPAGGALPLHPFREGAAPLPHSLRPCPELCAGRSAHSPDRRIHRELQLRRQQGPPVSLLFDSAASRRRPRGDPARKGRIPAAVVQREGHPDRHRTRKDRILPHAGLLAQLDQPDPAVHLLQRSRRTEHAGAETALLLQRCNAGGADHQPARNRGRSAQLGLPFLLAARCLDVHRDDVPRRTHRRRTAVHEVHPVLVHVTPRLPDHVRHPRRTETDRSDSGTSRRIQRLEARAHRQRRLPPEAERFVRLPDGPRLAVLPADAGHARRNRGHVGDGQEHPRHRRRRVAQSRQGDLGDPRRRAAFRLLEGDVLGGARPRGPHRGETRKRGVRGPLARGGRSDPPRRDGTRLEERNTELFAGLRQSGARFVAAAHGALRIHRRERPALPQDGRSRPQGVVPQRADVPLQQRGRFRRPQLGIHDVHLLAHPRAVRHGTAQRSQDTFQSGPAIRQSLGAVQRTSDFDTKEQLGNFPQAYSHLAIVNTALLFAEEKERLDFIRP